MGVSTRHTRRIMAAYGEEGAAALAHGHRGRRAPDTTPEALRSEVLVIARHRTASFVITSNRAVDEWLGLFDDSILGNSALDRLANASYQIVIEGASYRERLSPHRALLDRKEVVDRPNGDNSPSNGPQGGSMTLATTGL